jgi:hypothetical protein
VTGRASAALELRFASTVAEIGGEPVGYAFVTVGLQRFYEREGFRQRFAVYYGISSRPGRRR